MHNNFAPKKLYFLIKNRKLKIRIKYFLIKNRKLKIRIK